jgi:hypothetical protein
VSPAFVRTCSTAGATKTPPNFYRLTFLPDHEGGWPSDEWRRFESSDPKAWAVALARAKDIARAARKRRMGGKPFRSEEEADAANAPAKRRLKRIGKERINGPGNKQTRAALNEANGRNDSSKIHFAQRTSHPVEANESKGRVIPWKRPKHGRIVPWAATGRLVLSLLQLRYLYGATQRRVRRCRPCSPRLVPLAR